MTSTLKALLKPALTSFASRFGPHARKSATSKLWVLMYHRILPNSDARYQQEEPGMLVQPETFAMHIKELKRDFDLLALGDWVKARARGEALPKKACALTFDDGWRDNIEFAFPILKAESAPATLFAVANKIGTDFQFWPNIIALLLRHADAKILLQQPLFQRPGLQLKAHQGPPSPDALAQIINQLKQYSDDSIYAALDALNWRSLCPADLPPALMDWQELSRLQASGLVEIGSHTCSHKRLGFYLNQTEREHEIIDSKRLLEAKLHTPVNLFCFPNGDYDEKARALVSCHYAAAVTTRPGINQINRVKPFELMRIGLHEQVSNTRNLLRSRLSGWL